LLARALLDRLADHGYVEGKNLVIEARFAGYERLAEPAAELVRLHVDVIFTGAADAIVGGARLKGAHGFFPLAKGSFFRRKRRGDHHPQ
jgi:hypothetical protein